MSLHFQRYTFVLASLTVYMFQKATVAVPASEVKQRTTPVHLLLHPLLSRVCLSSFPRTKEDHNMLLHILSSPSRTLALQCTRGSLLVLRASPNKSGELELFADFFPTVEDYEEFEEMVSSDDKEEEQHCYVCLGVLKVGEGESALFMPLSEVRFPF